MPTVKKSLLPVILLILVFICPWYAATEEVSTAEDEFEPLPGALFINSQPINASILIDGEPVIQKTPAFLPEVSAGSHLVQVRKEGYRAFDAVININGDTLTVDAGLDKSSAAVMFPGEGPVYLRTGLEDRLLPEAFRLDEGSYTIEKDEKGLYVIPVYPKEGELAAVSILFLSSLAVTGHAFATEINSYGEVMFPHSSYLTLAETFSMLLGVAEAAFLIDKRVFLKDYRVYEADLDYLESEAEASYQSALQALSAGRIERALSEFSRLISTWPDSARFPEALYRTAKLHIISGDTNLAASELKIVIDNFPDPRVYDRACQALSLLYFNTGDTVKSRSYAERMVHIDPLFSETPDEVRDLGIDRVIENWARNPERQAE